MLTVFIILALTAFITTILSAAKPVWVPLWIPVMLLSVIALLHALPLGK